MIDAISALLPLDLITSQLDYCKMLYVAALEEDSDASAEPACSGASSFGYSIKWPYNKAVPQSAVASTGPLDIIQSAVYHL